jgi:hypothetical protein
VGNGNGKELMLNYQTEMGIYRMCRVLDEALYFGNKNYEFIIFKN